MLSPSHGSLEPLLRLLRPHLPRVTLVLLGALCLLGLLLWWQSGRERRLQQAQHREVHPQHLALLGQHQQHSDHVGAVGQRVLQQLAAGRAVLELRGDRAGLDLGDQQATIAAAHTDKTVFT